MKQIVALLLAAVLLPSAHAANVGVTVEVSQPGVYGRIDIGRFPQPAVIVPQPVIIAPQPVIAAPAVVVPQPVYMWVPPGHRKNWAKHCRHYDACGVPVYFVRHDWYDNNVRYKQKHPGRGKGRGRDD